MPQKVRSETPGRTCIKCGVTLVLGENWNKGAASSYHYICKECQNKKNVDWRNNLSDAEYLWKLAKQRARKKEREFTITVADVEAVLTDTCSILNIPIYRHPHQTGGAHQNIQPDSMSLDRIDASKGYTPDNIRIISWRANELLKDATIEELKCISEYYQKIASETTDRC